MEEPEKRKWVITPGLMKPLQDFERLVKVSNGRALLVTGLSGTGKTLFTDIFLEIKQNEVECG